VYTCNVALTTVLSGGMTDVSKRSKACSSWIPSRLIFANESPP